MGAATETPAVYECEYVRVCVWPHTLGSLQKKRKQRFSRPTQLRKKASDGHGSSPLSK